MFDPVKKRISKALQAGAFGHAVTILIQLVSVPLFIQSWGVSRYGEWLLLSTIPSYLALSDFGFGSAAANEMTMAAAAGDKERLISTYQSTWILLLVVSTLLLVALPIFGFAASHGSWLGIHVLSPFEVFWGTMFLGGGVCVSLSVSVVNAVYRCEGRYATGILYSNILRLADFAAMVIVVASGSGLVVLVVAKFVVSCLGATAIYWYAQSFAPWAKFGYRHARRDKIRELASPAFSFMAFPMGNAINLQGFTFLVGTQLGAKALVVFSTMRTMSRVASQAMNLINSSVWPELSRAFGQGDISVAREIHRHSCQASVFVAAGALAVLAAGGSKLMQFWTGGKVDIDVAAYSLLLGAMAVNSFWFTSSVVSVSVNKHQRMALAYLVASTCGLALGFLLINEASLPGAAAATLVVEIAMAVFVLPISLALTEDRFSRFCRSMVRWPTYLRGYLVRQ